MLTPPNSIEALTGLFRSRPVADLTMLCATLETESRMSVFRRLSAVGFLSSYSHAGQYYTLREIPLFDRDGLWGYQGVYFSRYGSLKSTLAHLVDGADAGSTQHELQVRLRVRVHNTLLTLVQEKRIGREPLAGQYLYVSADAGRRRFATGRAAEATRGRPWSGSRRAGCGCTRRAPGSCPGRRGAARCRVRGGPAQGPWHCRHGGPGGRHLPPPRG